MEKNDIREDLIQKIEELSKEEDSAFAFAKAKELVKRWPRVREEEESFADQELLEKREQLMDELAKKAGNVFINTEEKKNEIIAKAKEVINKNNFKKGTEEMKQLLEEWKLAGRLNKDKDDELWNQFSEVRKEFFDKKNEYFENLKASFAENKKFKEELIEKLGSFRGYPQEADLPSAPKQFIQYLEEDNRPQVALDVNYEKGMGVSIGRLREDTLFDWKFVGLSHNTIRGAAGGGVLCADLLTAQGYLTHK